MRPSWRPFGLAARDLLRGTARVVEAGPEVDGTCIGWGQDPRGAHGRLPRSIADELGGYLAGGPNDTHALVFTAPLGRSSRSAELLVAEAEEVGFEPIVGLLRLCRPAS
jgi:hypothetical protein